MTRYAAGDDAALAEVYDAVAPRLYGFLRRRSPDDAQAEDLLQQTFLRMHEARGSFVPDSPVVPWAFAIGRRLLIDLSRRNQRIRRFVGVSRDGELPERADTAADVELIAEARETYAQLLAALQALPETQREAFELVRFDGLSVNEAAATLGIGVSALKLRAHRAYKALGLSHTSGMEE